MVSFVVQSNMWQIILLNICIASLKFAVSEDLHYSRQLPFSLLLRAPLSYSLPSSNYPTRHFEERSFEVPLVNNNVNHQFEEPQTSPDNCPQLETLRNILLVLKRLLDHEDNSYVPQPDKRIQILHSLKEYLERGSHATETDNRLKLKELINRTDRSVIYGNDPLRQSIGNGNLKNHIEANFLLKYDIPNLNDMGCKEALATLIRTVKNAHLQLINVCNQTGNCKLDLEPDLSNIQHSDKTYMLHSNPTLGYPITSQSKITPLNQQTLNLYDVQNSINSLVKSKYQANQIDQNGSNDYLDPLTPTQTGLNNNQFLTSGVVHALNNEEKHLNAYNNIYTNTNKEASQSNIQLNDKSNALNSILSLYQPVPAPVQLSPSNRDILNIQNPLSNLIVPQNQGDSTQSGSNGYLNLHMLPKPDLNNNQLLTNGALNTGIVETKNLHNQEENINTLYNNFLNILPTSGIKEFEGNNNHLLLPQTQHVEGYVPINYNNDPREHVLYKPFQTLNDISSHVAMINQNDNNKESVQFEGASIPRYDYGHFNLQQSLKPNEIKNFAVEDLIPPNLDINLNKFKPQINPNFHSSLNLKENPYVSSINLNRHNSFNYNSQQADAALQSKFGLNIYAPTNFVDYPKRDIYGNTLVDSHRLTGMPNLVKLNSVTDNAGIVELTYKLKRPQSINYNPYYFIKFRMPYKDFVSKIVYLLKNPHLRSNPMQFYEKLLSLSNVAEASPELNNFERKEVSKLILNNGGSLVSAKVLAANDLNANQYLSTIQNLNAKLNTKDILKLLENDKKHYNNPYNPSNTNVPVYTPQDPYQRESLIQNVDMLM